jgi:hypothetical protein
VYGFRKATVKAANAATVAGDTSLVVALSPNSPTPMATSATSSLTNVTSAITSTTILAVNTARKGAIFFNDGAANLFLGFTASAVSATSYSVKLAAGAFFEVAPPIWTGQINGIWDVASGALRVTEFT